MQKNYKNSLDLGLFCEIDFRKVNHETHFLGSFDEVGQLKNFYFNSELRVRKFVKSGFILNFFHYHVDILKIFLFHQLIEFNKQKFIMLIISFLLIAKSLNFK